VRREWASGKRETRSTLYRGPRHSSAIKTSATAEGGSKKRWFYKPLPKRFQAGGFDYQQIYREGDFAIYRQTWKGNEDSAAFEVIQIRRREGFQVADKFVPAGEVYPRSGAWGADGWTMQSKDAAFRKLREIIAFRTLSQVPTKKRRGPH
jgi:hypothetical protein